MLLGPAQRIKLRGMQGLPKVPVCAVPSRLHTVEREAVPFLSPAQSTGSITPALFLQTSNTPEPNRAGPVAGLTIQRRAVVSGKNLISTLREKGKLELDGKFYPDTVIFARDNSAAMGIQVVSSWPLGGMETSLPSPCVSPPLHPLVVSGTQGKASHLPVQRRLGGSGSKNTASHQSCKPSVWDVYRA